jgi:hypothetical protein
MSETISNFIIGIGYDYNAKGEKQIGSGIDGLASKALMLGAVVAGAFGINALTADFAEATDKIGKFGQTFGLTADDVAGLGRAIQLEGGTFEAMISQLEAIERLRSMRPDEIGGLFSEAGIVGFDPGVILNAKDAAEAYIALGDVMQRASQSKRLQIADVVGLDPASIRLLSRGSGEVQNLVNQMKAMRPVTEDMTRESARFNDQLFLMKTNIGAISDSVAMELIPSMSSAAESANKLFSESNAPKLVGNTVKSVAENNPITVGYGYLEDAIDFLFNSVPNRVSEAVDEQKTIFNKTFGNSFNGTIQVNMLLDGQVLDQRIINVNEQQNQKAIDQLTTSTGG